MALLTSFDFLIRKNNKGKHTDSHLNVRFVTDGVSKRRVGQTTGQCLATRYVEKTYSWRGYDLNTAKQIANFYTSGNSHRRGLVRESLRYVWHDTAGWIEEKTFTNRDVITIEPMGGGMYAVHITIDEEDEFLVDDDKIPTDYEDWCGKFAAWNHHNSWAEYSNEGTGGWPYKFEDWYDEEHTIRDLS